MADCLDHEAQAAAEVALEVSVVVSGLYAGRPLAHAQAAELMEGIESLAARCGAAVSMSNVAVGEQSRMAEGAA